MAPESDADCPLPVVILCPPDLPDAVDEPRPRATFVGLLKLAEPEWPTPEPPAAEEPAESVEPAIAYDPEAPAAIVPVVPVVAMPVAVP